MANEWTFKNSKLKGLLIVHFFDKVVKEVKWTFNQNTSRQPQHSILSQNGEIEAVQSKGGVDVLKIMGWTHKTFIFLQFIPYEQALQILWRHLSSHKQEKII
jgi:hypothetical protein